MFSSKKNKSKKGKKSGVVQTSGNAITRVLRGNVITSDFFARHKLKILVVLVLTVIYISTKYQAMTSMETIRNLETKLEVTRTESVRERARYMSRIRESAMTELADSLLPGLKAPIEPPFRLTCEHSR